MITKRLYSLVTGRTPLVYLISEEEDRVERLVSAIAEKVGLKVNVWSCVKEAGNGDEYCQVDPVDTLDHFLKLDQDSLLIFKDLHLFVTNNARLIRKLKDCHRALRKTSRKIFFICPNLTLPEELFTLFKIEDVPLPRADELSKLLDVCVESKSYAKSLRASLTPELRDKIIVAAMGFTLSEAADAFDLALANEKTVTADTVDHVVDEKQRLVRKSGVLEYVSIQADTWEIGGLLNLKKWLSERTNAFSPQAAKLGLTPPKGILVMGVSGCGKSLCIKAIAAHWKLPLLRLDMGRLYDGLAGPPEEAMRKAIKTAEAVAPCVLWIDEIEAGIANQLQKQSGGKEARVLALFLTWMQEKTAPVFVGATANEVEVLPPEILRKGRFDELFYMGLPSKEERKHILTIHMRKRNVDPSRFDMDYLAESTEGLNGAEIEQGVISAIFESSSQDSAVTEHILANCLRNIVPLSRTMRERIQKIEAWARDRAMKASMETLQ
jgi:SpoVK/Ycf46/Vps4 family AAA+-type ATPase